MNKFKFSDDNKRYHTYNYYLRHKYGQKVFKVPLNGGFSCPNRDGKISSAGCSFCSEVGSGEYCPAAEIDLLTQYEINREMMRKKWPNALTMPYFQSFTNTYGPLAKIKNCVEPFLTIPEVKAIALGTRCDCLEDEKIAYLQSCTKKKDFWIELGLQSMHDETCDKLNRGHSLAQFIETIKRLKKTDIKICVHIINGLPDETKDMMIATAKLINELEVDALKIHMLYLIKNTKLTNDYLKEPFKILSLTEYVDLVCLQLQYLNPNIVIQRLTGDAVKDDLIEPLWSLNKTNVLNEIDKKMARDDLYQGQLCSKELNNETHT